MRGIARALDLAVDGTRIPLSSGAGVVSFPPGQAGLPTLRLVCRFRVSAALAGGRHGVRIDNGFERDRIGWREITAVGDHTTLLRGAPSAVSPSASLTKYPTDRLSSPLDERSADFSVRGGGAAAPRQPHIPTVTGSVVRGFDDLTQSLTSSVAARRLTLGLALVTVAISLGLGALHAFAPGHGKTVMAAYLVGERGTVKDGLLIGVTVATTHTLGVLLLGAVLTASQTFAPESVYPYLSLASGVCFAGLGVVLLAGALRRRRVSFFGLRHHHHGPGGHTHGPTDLGLSARHDHDPADAHAEHVHAPRELVGAGVAHGHIAGRITHTHGDHGHGDHGHDDHHHGHDHHDDEREHEHEHDEQPAALSRRRLLTLGFAGGLVPTPTAIVVLLGATAIGRGVVRRAARRVLRDRDGRHPGGRRAAARRGAASVRSEQARRSRVAPRRGLPVADRRRDHRQRSLVRGARRDRVLNVAPANTLQVWVPLFFRVRHPRRAYAAN